MNKPAGQRFTHVYRERGEITEDSPTFRRRLAHKISEYDSWDMISHIRAETGWDVNASPTSKWWINFISTLSLDDLLDFITISYNGMSDRLRAPFLAFVQRALREENVGFVVDEIGGVHHAVDQVFQDNRVSAINGLGSSEYRAAREAFEEAHACLSSHPADLLAAVRRAFDSVENVFKIKFQVSRLGASEIKTKLRSIGDGAGTRVSDAARRFNEAFAEWLNSCHQFRHAPGEADPSPPPRWLATALVDSAAIYLRYILST